MKGIIFILTFYLSAWNLFSQDTIIKRNGQVIIANILQVSSSEIVYKRYDMRDGPTYTEYVDEISSIKYYRNNADKPKEFQTYRENVKPDTISRKVIFKKHRLGLSINLLPIFINERSLYIDYTFRKKHSFGICGGYIYANKYLQVNPVSADQGKNPGTVWGGILIRFNYRFYFSPKKRHYFGIEYLYKSLSYSNMEFFNSIGERGSNTFYRSEKANLYGIDLLYGYHLISVERIFNLEWFCGISYRQRIRNYNTLSSTVQGGFQNPEPIGVYNLKQEYPFVFIGFKMGFNTHFK